MTILELEQLTGLERATIRYYEKAGLVQPQRKENSYRDYSEEDAQHILKIKLLRQLELPIETIKQLQQGSADFSQVLAQHVATLEHQNKLMEQAKAICKELSSCAVTYDNLDAPLYLEKMQSDHPDPAQTESNPQPMANYVEYHPVRRFIARIIDYQLLTTTVHLVMVALFRVRPYTDFLSNLVYYCSLLASVPLQALWLHLFATTPGKWLMGVQVISYKGKKMHFSDAILREWRALLYGYGLGIPFIRLWRLITSYNTHKRGKQLEQDIGTDLVYANWDFYWNSKMKSLFALACAIMIFTTAFTSIEMIRPKYTGNQLTIQEFSANYNYYAKLMEWNITMNPDGSWDLTNKNILDNDNTVIIPLGGIPEVSNAPLKFTTEGDRIQKITYQNRWTDITFTKPLSKELMIASLAVLLSNREISIRQVMNAMEQIDATASKDSAEIRVENIVICWKAQSVNCINSNGTYYGCDENKESSLSFYFEIVME